MGIPVGGQAVITLEVKDQNQQDQDPGSLSVVYQDPTGTKTTTSAGITKDSVGNYHYGLVLSIPGRWLFRFVGAGVYQGASNTIEVDCDPSPLA